MRRLLLALLLVSCRKDASVKATPAPVASASVQKTPTTMLTVQQLQAMHGELVGMVQHHDPLDKQLDAAKGKLGKPNEQRDGASVWYAWNASATEGAPPGCWQLVLGAVPSIGITVRAKCGM